MAITTDYASRFMLAAFDSTQSLLHAAEKLRDAGYKDFDCHSPFPVHGMDEAMGLKRSPVGYVVGVMGTLGLAGILLLTWWTSAVDYPFVISGKPYFSWQAYVPVLFAVTILMSAFGALFGMLHFNRQPQLHHPLLESETFEHFSNDGFFVSVEASDAKYDEEQTRQLLEAVGATNIEIVKHSS